MFVLSVLDVLLRVVANADCTYPKIIGNSHEEFLNFGGVRSDHFLFKYI